MTHLYSYDISTEGLVAVGGATELIGRFDSVYNFHKMDFPAFENFLDKTIETLAIEQQILITATDNAYDAFFSIANSEFGCRYVKCVLYQTIKHQLMDALSVKDRTLLMYRHKRYQ